MSKVIVITGASRGIGRAIASGFAKLGFSIAALDLASEKAHLESLKKFVLEETSGECYIDFLDITDEENIHGVLKNIEKEFGEINVLVNNAGILTQDLVEDLSEDAWSRVMDVNAKGTFLMSKAVIPYLKKHASGSIINIASIGGKKGAPQQAHYCASKGAVIEFTRVLAMELGEYNIRVNAVCPGIILTEMGKNNLKSEEKIKYWTDQTSLKRLGQPEDVFGTVKFFASDDSEYITGQSLNVCGGIIFY